MTGWEVSRLEVDNAGPLAVAVGPHGVCGARFEDAVAGAGEDERDSPLGLEALGFGNEAKPGWLARSAQGQQTSGNEGLVCGQDEGAGGGLGFVRTEQADRRCRQG